jgi:hypothetical protein
MNGKWGKLGVKTGKITATDPYEQREMVASMLKHNGTALVVRTLDNICKVKLLEYDKAILSGDLDKAREIAAFRHVCGVVIPDVIEQIMNCREPRPSWTWLFSKWFMKILKRKRR